MILPGTAWQHWNWSIEDVYDNRVLAMTSPSGEVLSHNILVFSIRRKIWFDPHLTDEDRDGCALCVDRGPKPEMEILIRGIGNG